jgi:energy-coupling factor transporter transmembrane protein EcfT
MGSNDKNALWKSLAIGILVAVGLFSAVVFLSNSWIKLLVIGLILVSCIFWVVSHGLIRKIFKYTILALMIFAVSFAAFEGYVLWNAGYPPTFEPHAQGVTISYSNILNASLTQIIQSIEDSPTFGFIMLEHPSKVTIETISLETNFVSYGGSINVLFYQPSSHLDFRFYASGGYHYHATISTYGGTPLSQMYPQQQADLDSLKQIDTLGLNSFYNTALEAYQNKTGAAPTINSLSISIQWEQQGSYQGMTMLLTGGFESNNLGHGVFFADFQPNGTLLYINPAS